MVVNAERRSWQSLQQDSEASGRGVEAAGLNPHALGVWHPESIVAAIEVGDEMAAPPRPWAETIIDAAEDRDRHGAHLQARCHRGRGRRPLVKRACVGAILRGFR